MRAVAPGLAAAAAVVFAAAPVHGQHEVPAERIRLVVHSGATVLRHEGTRAGLLLGATAAYERRSGFGVFASFDRATIGGPELDFTLRHLDLGVHYLLRPGATLRPLVFVGYGWRTADYGEREFQGDVGDFAITGGGPMFGAGLTHALTDRIALDASLAWSIGDIDRITFLGMFRFRDENEAIDGASMRLRIGASIVLLRR